MKRIVIFFGVMAAVSVMADGLCSDSVDYGKRKQAFASPEDFPDANTPVSLQDYLRYAALNNAGLKAAFEEWKAALEQVPQAKALPDPRFTYGYFIEEVETRVGPQKNRFGIMQAFPWFGEIEARADAAAAAAKAARQRYEAGKLKLFFEVKDAFYEYAYLARAVEIARENLELIKHFEEVARTKYVAAAAGHPDVIRAQVELAKLEDHLKSLEAMREPIVARLNAVLNRGSFEMLPWPEKVKFEAVEVRRSEIVAALKTHNPELQAMDFEVENARSRLEVARKKFYPEIGVGVDWIQTDEALMAGTRDSGKDPVILMFSMNLPIWRKSYKAAQLQAEANVRKASQQRAQEENSIIAGAERALYDFEDSGRKIKLYRDVLVPKAEELLSVSETAYKGGTVDFLSLIDAQRMLLGYQLNYERAVTNNLQRLGELEMLAGAKLGTIIDTTAAK
ncbi:MAG TPA: TolC family protein [Sedimentisphaerales bacterium]|nr:TolC family protein [Sedimentisphaerales bacterium]